MRPRWAFASVVTVVAMAACSGSGNSVGPGPASTATGEACTSAAECYPDVDAGALAGQATCLTQLQNGYCTHACQSDADCCAVAGECPYALPEVCAPFESTGQTYCFLGCDATQIASVDAGTTDPTMYCQRWANATFTCRSTGGGSTNRQFCGP
ncbi:MAG: hypothetical protein ACRELB_12915 [Polyangiaceae bacterium]